MYLIEIENLESESVPCFSFEKRYQIVDLNPRKCQAARSKTLEGICHTTMEPSTPFDTSIMPKWILKPRMF